jgi:hypothetical protein
MSTSLYLITHHRSKKRKLSLKSSGGSGKKTKDTALCSTGDNSTKMLNKKSQLTIDSKDRGLP